MGIFSLLPESLSFIETWLARIFLLLATLTLGPWLLVLLYDLLLYLWRLSTYNLPFIGGRARGRQRPRAPSLTERPSGHRRKISLAGIPTLREGSGREDGAGVIGQRVGLGVEGKG